MSNIGMSVIVPFLNEEKAIPIFCDAMDRFISELPFPVEIIFVNDGSRDKTMEKLDQLLELSKQKPIYAIPEEDTIYVEDDKIEFIGSRPYFIFENGNMKKVEIVNNK